MVKRNTKNSTILDTLGGDTMFQIKKFKDILWIVGGTLAFAIIAGLGSMKSAEVYSALELPPLAPPPWLYGVVWPVLYALMAIAAILIKRRGEDGPLKKEAMATYWVQLAMNAIWPYLFFLLRIRFFAFMWLVVLLYFVVLLTIRYWRLYKLSGALLVPYVLWTAFATYLNYFTWLLNR